MNRLNRRAFLATSLGALATTSSVLAQQSKRPNVLIIMADDMGFSDLGCYGGEIATPNIDGLAKNGIRFTQFYNAARCCPTRAALLTGLYNHQAGVGDMVNSRPLPAYQGYLNQNCVTLAEAIKPAGYRAYMAGKWHVGEAHPHWPVDRGFDRYFGLISGASSYFKVDAGRTMALDNEKWTPGPGHYMTDAFSEWAVKYIDDHAKQNASQPFLMYVAYTSPHWPLHALPEDIAKYKGKYRKGWDALRVERHKRQVEMGLVDAKWGLSPRGAGIPAWDSLTPEKQEDFDQRMSVYAAQIDRMDQGIGKILAALRRTGQFDNTVILFLADNGGCHEELNRGEKADALPGAAESYTSYGRPWANASNTPFRMYKHWTHEGGISSPLIAHWPAALKKGGGWDRDPAHVTDLMATALDAAGAAYPKTHQGNAITPIEGRSLLPALQGKKRQIRDAIFWEHEGARAVRQGRWKLVAEHNGPWQLYDMLADRCEAKDLIAAQPDRAAQLEKMWNAWAERCGVVQWSKLPKPGARA